MEISSVSNRLGSFQSAALITVAVTQGNTLLDVSDLHLLNEELNCELHNAQLLKPIGMYGWSLALFFSFYVVQFIMTVGGVPV